MQGMNFFALGQIQTHFFFSFNMLTMCSERKYLQIFLEGEVTETGESWEAGRALREILYCRSSQQPLFPYREPRCFLSKTL